MTKKSPQEIESLLSKIPADSETVLVGGHAINLWATAYQKKIPQLQEYLPFSSEDLDFIGGRVEAVEFQEQLGGILQFPPSFSPSPNTAILTTKLGSDNLRIDFLSNAFGLDSEQVSNTAISFRSSELPDVTIKVLNPILCVAGKLKSYTGLPQFGRQDKKHLNIAILIAREYVNEVCLTSNPRNALKLIERLAKMAKSEAGLKVWQQDRIDILQTIDVETINTLTAQQWQKVKEIRLPQLFTEVNGKRGKYDEIIQRQEIRRQEIAKKKDLER